MKATNSLLQHKSLFYGYKYVATQCLYLQMLPKLNGQSPHEFPLESNWKEVNDNLTRTLHPRWNCVYLVGHWTCRPEQVVCCRVLIWSVKWVSSIHCPGMRFSVCLNLLCLSCRWGQVRRTCPFSQVPGMGLCTEVGVVFVRDLTNTCVQDDMSLWIYLTRLYCRGDVGFTCSMVRLRW